VAKVTVEELEKLSLPAIVAFAARCAERVDPARGRDGDPNHGLHKVMQKVRNVIDLTIKVVDAVERFSDDDEDVVKAYASKAAAAAGAIPKRAMKDNAFIAAEFILAAQDAAQTAVYVAQAVCARGPEEFDTNVTQATTYASKTVGAVYSSCPHGVADARADYKYLIGKKGPINYGDMEPIWSRGAPPQNEEPGDSEASAPKFSLDLSFPADWTDEQVKAHTLDVIRQLNEVYQECGGDGLKVDDVSLFEPARELV